MTEASTKSRFVAAVDRSAAAGEFTPDTRRNMKCARCGGQMVIFKYAEPSHGADLNIKALPVCELCRVDRVKRWGDLLQASAERGRELRTTVPSTPHGRACEAAGLVRYVARDGAWELTKAGEQLLADFDAKET